MSGDEWRAAVALLQRVFREETVPPAPAGLFGRPCELPAAAWHLQQLAELGREPGAACPTPAQQARRLYHQRMLAHLIAPQGQELRPLVTILIPVYNRSRLLLEAVRSCLEQSWRPIEILVIDDGSDEDLARALQEVHGEVRLHRKPNGGVASARNVGIRLARGDFVHLLDSDDLLLPDAVASKVESFAAIPDAALCYSMAIEHNLPDVPVPRIRMPDGSERCTTSDPLYAALNRCPFYVPTVMMPRWAMLAFPPFEEDLRRGEDSRYWVKLGLAGAKVIGLAQRLTVRRMVPEGISTKPHVGHLVVDIKLRNLRDVLHTPSTWHHAGSVVANFVNKLEQGANPAVGALDRIPAYRDVLGALAGLGDSQAREGLSPVPLLVDMKNALHTAKPDVGQRWPMLWRDLDDAISSALESAAPMTHRDLLHWGHPTLRIHGRTSIAGLFQALLKAADKEPAIARRIDPVLRRTFPTPSSPTVKRYRKLRRKLRSGQLAAWLTWPSAYLRPLR